MSTSTTFECARAVLRAEYVRQKALKDARTIKVIKAKELPNEHTRRATTAGKTPCRAVTMTGKPCPYKACSGGLCKRHAL